MKDAIICDNTLHVNMFHYFKTPILYVRFFLQNLSIMNILDLVFLSHVFSTIFAKDPLECKTIILDDI